MDYNDAVKEITDKIWKLTQLIMGLAIGVIAFSIQNLGKDESYKVIELLFCSWGLLGIAFLLGIFRLQLSIMSSARGVNRFYKVEILKQKVEFDEKEFQKRNKNSAIVYWLMIIFFISGTVMYSIFKVSNIQF